MVVLACGHIEIAYPIVKVLFATFPTSEVFCETCEDWICVSREAMPAEIVGIELPQLSLSDIAPF